MIVVDNASFDDSRKSIRADFPTVRIVKSDKNVGFATAAQAGFHEAASDVVVFCHTDLVAPMHTLAELADQVREGRAGASRRRCRSSSAATAIRSPSSGACRAFARMIGSSIALLRDVAICRRSSTWRITSGRSAPAWPCVADVLQSVGGFDRRFFLYFADADLCHACTRSRGASSFARNCAFVHTGRVPNDPLPDGLRRSCGRI